jgi:hypothetical protein
MRAVYPESSEQVLSTIDLCYLLFLSGCSFHTNPTGKFSIFRIALNCLTHVNWLFSFYVVSPAAKIGIKSSCSVNRARSGCTILTKTYYPVGFDLRFKEPHVP